MAGISGAAAAAGLYQKNALNAASQLAAGGTSSASALGDSTQQSVSFSDVLKDAIQQSEDLNTQSNADTLNLLSGNTDDMAGLLMDAKKSELALNLTIAIRNKAVDAYKEIMNMQI
jgi:flagellar hook-basal body complex protein FliE